MSYTSSILLSVISVALLSSSVFAAEPRTIPQIVISATRSPTDINNIASSVTLISQETIQRKNKTTVTELLREVPGLAVANNGGSGQTTRIFVRGTNSNHVLVLLDGIALNDPSDPGDAFDFSNLTTDNIEQIEILRGAQSTLYGSQAIGGVINIITRKGKGQARYNANAEYGRYNTARLSAGSSGEIGNTSYSLQASQSHTAGISSFGKKRGGTEKDGSDATTASANIIRQLTEAVSTKFNLRYSRTVTEFDSAGSQIPRPFDDSAPENDSRQWVGRIASEVSHLAGKWKQELGIGLLHLNRSQITEYYNPGATFGRQQYKGWRYTLDWVHRVALIKDHFLTFGVDNTQDHFKALAVREKNTNNTGLFFDDQYVITPNLFVNAGIRSDLQQSFGRQTTWKIAPGYTVPLTKTKLKMSYGTGFKAPSLSQLFDTSSGNPDLKPEKSRSVDVGFEQPFWNDKVAIGITLFRNYITNLVGFNNSPPFAAINSGKARTQGLESSFSFRPNHRWEFTATHTFTQADDRKKSEQLARRPKHTANISATYQTDEDWDLTANIRHVGKSRDIDYDSPFGRVFVKSFTTVDVSGNYRLTPGITVYGRVENLFDKRYEEVFGYGQAGVSLFGGVKTQF